MNETTGWAVGDSGLILKTTNGGENWISSLAGNKPLRAFHFFDENTGVIVGGNTGTFYTGTSRLVIKTTNGGVNWHTIMNSTDVPFRNIQFVNDSVGLIGVNGVLKTTNKGDTWQYYGGINSEYCFFLNENTGYATSGSFPMIYKTTNGGINWSIIYYTGMFNFSGGVFFCNLNTGYAIGQSTILKTTDAGNSWQNKSIIDYFFRNAIFFSDPNHGVILSNSNVPNYKFIQSTTNGGESWYINNSPGVLNSVFFIDNNTGWITGDDGKILKTTTGGITFINETTHSVPKNIKLHQNYPNPFNPITNIKFEIPSSLYVTIKVYTVLGKEVATLVNKFLNKRTYQIEFNGSNLESGIYFYRIQAGDFTDEKLMILLK